MKPQNSLESHLISLGGNSYCLNGLLKLVNAICKLPAKYVDNSLCGCKTATIKRNKPKEDEQ